MADKKALTLKLEKDKETKGAVRFSDGKGHSIYFKKEEATKHDLGDEITVKITGES